MKVRPRGAPTEPVCTSIATPFDKRTLSASTSSIIAARAGTTRSRPMT